MNLLLIGADFNFCSQASPILQIVGYVLLAFKILIPLLLLILGAFELGRAIVAQKDDEVKKATSGLVKKLVIGIVIFLLPTLIGLIFSLISQFKDDKAIEAEYKICRWCVVSPTGSDCKDIVNKQEK